MVILVESLDFSGKQIFVVGGSSGIGNGIAHAFLERGAKVYVSGTRAHSHDYAGEEGSLLVGLNYIQLDLSNARAIDSFQPPFSRLDVLILCQGTLLLHRAEYDRAGWDKVMTVNLDSVMDCARHFHAMLVESRGAMILVGSTSGFLSSGGNPAYGASKAAVHHLTGTLGEAWARDGVRVNGIAPGLVPTKLTTIHVEKPERLERAKRSIPLGRTGTPAEMGSVALFLASPLASYIVGQTIVVDGGFTLTR